MVSDSTLQFPLRNCPLFSMNVASKNNISNDLKRLLKSFLPFPTTYLCQAEFSLYALTRTMYHDSLDTEADKKIQMSPIKLHIQQIDRSIKQCYSYL